MKTAIKILILFIFSALAIYFMYSQEIIDVNALLKAFENHKKLILLIAFIQILNCLFMTFRYFSLLKLFHVKADFQNVVGATFVSNGIGQWLPGSMAVIEVIRIGLMLGANNHHNQKINSKGNVEVKENLAELTVRSKLAAVSIMDRLIGLLVMLFFGLIMTGYIYLSMSHNGVASGNLLSFFILCLIFFIMIILLPIFARVRFFRRFFTRIERFTLTLFRKGFLNKIFRKIFHEINSLFDAIVLGSRRISSFWKPIIFSMITVLCSCLGMYLSGLAVLGTIPFEAILATISILSIASLLPLGLGGMGGMQIIAAIVFSIFQVSPQSAVSAQLLQTAVNLLANSAVGLLFARLSAKQIRAILLSKKSEDLLANKNM
jgi:uncharacterized membrane protein YbhN (UPF0104 family)